MKKILIPFLVLVAFGFIACGSDSGPDVNTESLPEWFVNVPIAEDAYYAAAMYKSTNVTMAINAATAEARNEIGRQVEVTVQSAIKQYAQEAGVDGNVQVINFIETVSKQISDATLNGSKVIKKEIKNDGTVFVLVQFEKAGLREVAEEKLFERNEDAAFAEFKADEAMRFLDAELEKQ